jgi:hypothetical protein
LSYPFFQLSGCRHREKDGRTSRKIGLESSLLVIGGVGCNWYICDAPSVQWNTARECGCELIEGFVSHADHVQNFIDLFEEMLDANVFVR